MYLSVAENKIVRLLSVALALRAIAAAFLHVPLHLSLVPAFSCELLCYPEWRKEQNLPYLSLVNALHEGEIVEMLWLKKKSHQSAFSYCFHTCGELEVLKCEVHWEKKNQEENVFWKNKPGWEVRFLPFLTIFFKKNNNSFT